jgi:hypothetical protein
VLISHEIFSVAAENQPVENLVVQNAHITKDSSPQGFEQIHTGSVNLEHNQWTHKKGLCLQPETGAQVVEYGCGYMDMPFRYQGVKDLLIAHSPGETWMEEILVNVLPIGYRKLGHHQYLPTGHGPVATVPVHCY